MNFVFPAVVLMRMKRVSTIAVCACAVTGAVAHSADPGLDVLRLQQQRDQQQLELRLKMQQQQERATRPASTPSAELQRLQIERDQQQRQRETHDQQSRAAILPDATSDDAHRAGENERAVQSGAEQLQRFEIQRRFPVLGQPAAGH